MGHNMFGGVVYNAMGDACDISVEQWFAQAVNDYIETHKSYCYHSAFIFLHRRCFEQERPVRFHSMRGNTTLLLAQAIGDYSVLRRWCIDGEVARGVRWTREEGGVVFTRTRSSVT